MGEPTSRRMPRSPGKHHKATRGQKGFFPTGFGGSRLLPTLQFQTCRLQNVRSQLLVVFSHPICCSLHGSPGKLTQPSCPPRAPLLGRTPEIQTVDDRLASLSPQVSSPFIHGFHAGLGSTVKSSVGHVQMIPSPLWKKKNLFPWTGSQRSTSQEELAG